MSSCPDARVAAHSLPRGTRLACSVFLLQPHAPRSCSWKAASSGKRTSERVVLLLKGFPLPQHRTQSPCCRHLSRPRPQPHRVTLPSGRTGLLTASQAGPPAWNTLSHLLSIPNATPLLNCHYLSCRRHQVTIMMVGLRWRRVTAEQRKHPHDHVRFMLVLGAGPGMEHVLNERWPDG